MKYRLRCLRAGARGRSVSCHGAVMAVNARICYLCKGTLDPDRICVYLTPPRPRTGEKRHSSHPAALSRRYAIVESIEGGSNGQFYRRTEQLMNVLGDDVGCTNDTARKRLDRDRRLHEPCVCRVEIPDTKRVGRSQMWLCRPQHWWQVDDDDAVVSTGRAARGIEMAMDRRGMLSGRSISRWAV